MERFNSDQEIAYSNMWVDDVFHKTVATKPHGKSPEKWVTTLILDFTGCSKRDTQEYAASRAIIEWQGGFRNKCCPKERKDGTRPVALSEGARMEYPTVIDMKAKMDSAKKAADPVAQVNKAKAKMTREQKLELMAALEEELATEEVEVAELLEVTEGEEATG